MPAGIGTILDRVLPDRDGSVNTRQPECAQRRLGELLTDHPPMSVIEGYVEAIGANHATGWAAEIETSTTVEVVLRTEAGIVARTSPGFRREDVESATGVAAPQGFFLAHENLRQLVQNGAATLEAGNARLGYTPLQIVADALTARPDRYQSFGDAPGGSSRSASKLAALQLQDLEPLKGRAVRILDIGCNEGFFSNALGRYFDAAYVLGVDTSADYIARARQRFPDIEFKVQSWWDVEEAEFDVIAFLSASHYEQKQEELFSFLAGKLSSRGVLILECGVADPLMLDASERWVIAHRHDGLIRYPTYNHLTRSLLRKFSSRYVGLSVEQDGDPVCRYVFHCRPKRQEMILLDAESGAGKTQLARQLATDTTQVIHTDLVVMRLLTDPKLDGWGLAAKLRGIFQWPVDIDLVQHVLADQGLMDEVVDFMMLAVDAAAPTVVIEGTLTRSVEAMARVKSQAADCFKVWRLA